MLNFNISIVINNNILIAKKIFNHITLSIKLKFNKNKLILIKAQTIKLISKK